MPGHLPKRRLWVGSTVLGLSLLIACQSTAVPPSGLELDPVTLPNLDERALLLLLADRQIYESFVVGRALEGGVELRRQLARALGRSGARQGRPMLERLLEDADAEVRYLAIFGLGELEDSLATRPLLEISRGADRPAAVLAVEALAKLGTQLEDVRGALGALGDAERAARLLPSLFRFDDTGRVLTAARWLPVENRQLHAWAAYALARDAVPEAATYLRPLISDADPWVRGWAARALGTIGSAEDLARLRPLLADAQEGPIVQALRAAGRLIDEGKAAPPPGWIAEIERLARDPRPGVRLTALEVAAGWLPDPALGELLASSFASGSPRERQVALLSLAAGSDPRAADATRRAAADGDVQLRRRAPAAAADLGLSELVLEMMLSDPHPAVRVDAVSALLGSGMRSDTEIAELALADTSGAVRTVALRWLIDNPDLAAERILQALRPADGDERLELESSAVRALAARAGTVDAEAAVILDALERLGRADEFLVRRAVAEVLEEMGLRPMEVGPASELRDLHAYGEIVLRTSRTRWARIETARGDVTVRLECPIAPLTCLSFLQLAEQEFFDGLTFHRVVPDFVVQSGDPSGAGWGGPGYALRDEINRLRFDAGVIGMAHSGPHTAGSQFFITLSSQPHLDGGYTVFGRVVAGLDVLHRLEQEDRISRVREVPAPPLLPRAARVE